MILLSSTSCTPRKSFGIVWRHDTQDRRLISDIQHYDYQHNNTVIMLNATRYAECRVLFIVILSVVESVVVLCYLPRRVVGGIRVRTRVIVVVVVGTRLRPIVFSVAESTFLPSVSGRAGAVDRLAR